MNADTVTTLAMQALTVTLEVSMPFLLTGLAVGLVVSVIQAVTSIQEPTLTFIPKILAVVVVIACAGVLFTGIDPILVTEYSVVFSAIALPLTYLPILIVANDPGYMGEHVNGRATNIVASLYLVIILAASLAAIPLMIVTEAGQ